MLGGIFPVISCSGGMAEMLLELEGFGQGVRRWLAPPACPLDCSRGRC